MPNFTFTPGFEEFLPVYQYVSRIWIGNGINTGTSGMLYAEYKDGTVTELGSVSLYATAVENGFTGTESQWLQSIIGIVNLIRGSTATISYLVSNDGVNHPDEDAAWSSTPSFAKGQFTWAKVDLRWVDGNTTSLYFCTYQGADGQVQSVNGSVGDVVLHGENLAIGDGESESIKEYVDDAVEPVLATDEEIDSMFSSVFFSGSVHIIGRSFESGDSVTLSLQAITTGAPMPQSPTVTVYPTRGNSCRYKFGYVVYDLADIPEGSTTKTYEYKIKESSHTLSGATQDTSEYIVSVTLTNVGHGVMKIDRSENFNNVSFINEYSALGRIVFEGNITLDGRAMAAREFMVQIKEGNNVIADNISTTTAAASGAASAISFPPINYTLADIGTHIYTVRETSTSGNGVTISDTVYTVTVVVSDQIRDGVLEIETNGSHQNLDFVNTYEASGSVTFIGTKSIQHRLFRNTDTYSVSIASGAKLPSPATQTVVLPTGESTVNFSFPELTYTLNDMRNAISGYDDQKTFVYTVTETANIPGVIADGLIHTITVTVTDNKLGQLLINTVYSDNNKVEFGGVYAASGSIVVSGTKTLTNRNFVASDTMAVSIVASNNGNLPSPASINVPLTAGTNAVDFNFVAINYSLADIEYLASKTFNYVVTENTVITGATNDILTHTVSILVSDNYDGTLSVVPTYSDGNKLLFASVYDATGYLAISGTKTIVNRQFKNNDMLSVAIAANNGGKLPNITNVSVPLTTGAYTANFNFNQITYKITDLGGSNTSVFNYTVTETASMDATVPVSATDTVAVTVTDNADGTLNVVPSYTSNNKVTFTNVYSATGSVSFVAKVLYNNGNMHDHNFTVRLTQVTGNNSTTQAVENVVLAAPQTVTVDAGNSTDVEFSNIVSFVKNSVRDDTQNEYWFLLEQVLPTFDTENIYNNARYDTTKRWINVSLTDDLSGHLVSTKAPAASGRFDITFMNEQLSSIVVNNVWSGDDSALTTAQKNAFVFNVVGPNNYSSSFTYADMVNNSYTVPYLSAGEYTITEANNIVENFSIATSYSVNNVSTNVIVLTDKNSKTITVTNAVNKLEASLTIEKVWSGDHAELTTAQKNAFTFTVTGPKQQASDANNFSATFTYADMVANKKTFTGLTLGTYTVLESNNTVSDFTVATTYQVGNNTTNSAVLGDGDDITIVVTNAVTQHKGNLTITKTFVDSDSVLTSTDMDETSFSVAGVTSTSFTYDEMTNGSITIQNLPVGTYTITEVCPTITGYDLTTTYELDGSSTNSNSVTITNGNTSVFAVTNTYTQQTQPEEEPGEPEEEPGEG